MLTAYNVILVLKVLVIAVTLLFLSSLGALAAGKLRLHGRINLAFTILTATALLGLEVVARLIDPAMFADFDKYPDLRKSLTIHLCFSLPAATIMPFMLWTGFRHRRPIHLYLAGVFSVLWLGTFVTGIFFLPHTAP